MRLLITITCILISNLTYGGITPSADSRKVPGAWFEYEGAERLIRLSDGSDFLIFRHPAPNEPGSTKGSLVSSRGALYNMTFGVGLWIPEAVAEGTGGQIYSAALSDDANWLAVVGGWMGKQDRRGHNGVFILQRQPLGAGFEFWKLRSWFDVPGMTVGEIEFGIDDIVLTTSHDSEESAIITAFTFAGQKLGSFVDAGKHTLGACRQMRIQKLASSSFALYDPGSSCIRFLSIASKNGEIVVDQTRIVTITFPENPSFLLAFNVLTDGRIAVARTIIDDQHRGRTLISILSSLGEILEEWASPRVWRYSYADKHTLNGIMPTAPDNPMPVIRSVTIQ